IVSGRTLQLSCVEWTTVWVVTTVDSNATPNDWNTLRMALFNELALVRNCGGTTAIALSCVGCMVQPSARPRMMSSTLISSKLVVPVICDICQVLNASRPKPNIDTQTG